MILESFHNSAKSHPTCILPSVREGLFNAWCDAKVSLSGPAEGKNLGFALSCSPFSEGHRGASSFNRQTTKQHGLFC